MLNNEKEINVATTSCKMVDWEAFEKEITQNNLIIKNKWISEKIPEFDKTMCVVVSRNE